MKKTATKAAQMATAKLLTLKEKGILQQRANALDDGQLELVAEFLRPELGCSFDDAAKFDLDMDTLSICKKLQK